MKAPEIVRGTQFVSGQGQLTVLSVECKDHTDGKNFQLAIAIPRKGSTYMACRQRLVDAWVQHRKEMHDGK